jgi:hypothetical protein
MQLKDEMVIDALELTTDDIYTSLAANLSWRFLNIKFSIIDAKVATKLMALLRHKDNLLSLNFTICFTQINDEGYQVIAEALRSNSLTSASLEFSYNSPNGTGNGELALVNSLAENTTLKRLVIWEKFQIEIIRALTAALKKNSTIQEIDLFLSTGNEGATALSEALSINRSLQKFSLADPTLNDAGVIALANSLQNHPTVNSFSLPTLPNITSKGFQALLDHLISNTALKKLEMGVDLDEERAHMLKNFLFSNSVLQDLEISGQIINDQAIQAIAETLTQQAKVSTLILNKAQIQEEGGNALAQALLINTNLQALHLTGKTIISLSSLRSLTQALTSNKTLHTLNFDGASLGDEGIIEIANLLKVITPLRCLSLKETQMGEEGIKALTAAFYYHPPLCYLEVGDNVFHTTINKDIIEHFEQAATSLPWGFYVSGFNGTPRALFNKEDDILSRQEEMHHIMHKILRYCKRYDSEIKPENIVSLKEIKFLQNCVKYVPHFKDTYLTHWGLSEEDQVLLEKFLTQDWLAPSIAFTLMGIYQNWQEIDSQGYHNWFSTLPPDSVKIILAYLANDPQLLLKAPTATEMAIAAAGVCAIVEEATEVIGWGELPFGEEL